VSWFVTVIRALVIRAPLGSVTVPDKVARPVWDRREVGSSNRIARHSTVASGTRQWLVASERLARSHIAELCLS
jgi:hypothetical protein